MTYHVYVSASASDTKAAASAIVTKGEKSAERSLALPAGASYEDAVLASLKLGLSLVSKKAGPVVIYTDRLMVSSAPTVGLQRTGNVLTIEAHQAWLAAAKDNPEMSVRFLTIWNREDSEDSMHAAKLDRARQVAWEAAGNTSDRPPIPPWHVVEKKK